MPMYNEEFVKSLVGKFISCTNVDIPDVAPEIILVTGYEFIMLGDNDIPTGRILYVSCDVTEECCQIFLEPNSSAIDIKIIA